MFGPGCSAYPGVMSSAPGIRSPLLPSRAHARVLVVAILIVSVNTQPVFLLGAGALQIGGELDFGPVGLGILTGIYFLTASLLSAPAGRIVERIGWQRSMRFNALGAAGVLFAIATLARSTWALGVLLAIGALFYAFGNPAANQALANMTATDRQGLVFGLKHAGIPTSTLLAGLAVPLVILTLGWRWAYVFAAALAVAVYFVVPHQVPTATVSVTEPASTRPLSPNWLLLLSFGGAFATIVPAALGTFTVSAAVDAGISEGTAGIVAAFGGFVTITARIVLGRAADARRWVGFRELVVLYVIGALVCFALSGVSGALFVPLLLMLFATGWGWPGLMTYAVVRANSGTPASSSSIMQAGLFFGAAMGPAAFGAVVERWSYAAAWLGVGVALVAAAAVLSIVARHQTR